MLYLLEIRKEFMKIYIIAVILTMVYGCNVDYQSCDNVKYVDIRKEYITVLCSKPSPDSNRKKTDIECAYNNMVLSDIVSKKEFHGFVQDELGNIMTDYKLVISWDIYNKRNRVESSKTMEKQLEKQGFIVKWTNNTDVVSISITKPGYQNQAINFENKITRNYEIYLKGGQLKPSANDGEYVITLHPSNIWGPFEKEGFYISKTMWPNEIPINSKIVSSSIDEWTKVAPESGIFALVDNNNKIYAMQKLNEGDNIGFQIYDNKRLFAIYRGDSRSLDLNDKIQLYEWKQYMPLENIDKQSNLTMRVIEYPKEMIIITEPD